MSQEKTFKTLYHRDYYGTWIAHIDEIDGRQVKTNDSLIINQPSKEVCQQHLLRCLRRIVGERYTQYKELAEVVGATAVGG